MSKNIGEKILFWYEKNARKLPWRETKNPYHIWISEIILQQTRVKQGEEYYLNFIKKFPTLTSLANADIQEVLLLWKGLGYYSRAINLHQAAQQILNLHNGIFPKHHPEIFKLKGIGKYTAAAISSICFEEKIPAIDGNFYRVLSRFFADDFDISKNSAYSYFFNLALKIMPEKNFGNFNQAIMDLGSEICKIKNPICQKCPINEDCKGFHLKKTDFFPFKTKKIKPKNAELFYYFIKHENSFLIKQRDQQSIWKKLYDFPEKIDSELEILIQKKETFHHKLTHLNLVIHIFSLKIEDEKIFKKIKNQHHLEILNFDKIEQKSFPKPIENFLNQKSKII